MEDQSKANPKVEVLLVATPEPDLQSRQAFYSAVPCLSYAGKTRTKKGAQVILRRPKELHCQAKSPS